MKLSIDAKNISSIDEAQKVIIAFSRYADSMIETFCNIPEQKCGTPDGRESGL